MAAPSGWSRSLVAERERGARIGRHALLQSLALIAFAGTLAAMIVLGHWLPSLPEDVLRLTSASILALTSAAAMALLPSSRTRAWAKGLLARHLVAHRYDYRAEWLRLTATLGEGGEGAPPLAERAARAIADITGSPAALLLPAGEDGALGPALAWRWPDPPQGQAEPLAGHLRATGCILAFDALSPDQAALLPEWMRGERALWAGVPLRHAERLEGLLLLARPPVRRDLDREDFDLLGLAATQAASHLAEARAQEALADARRFAFVMHDIKNLVSQLALVARNAERHAASPASCADMIATLNGSAARMNDMLGRLSPRHQPRGGDARVFSLGRAACKAAQAKRMGHKLTVDADPCLAAWGDAARLDRALEHLIQNAIEASPPGVPVRISTARDGDEAVLVVADGGQGMTPDFIRTTLFRPSASTRPDGFGIGAYEVRALVRAMGGRLEVASSPGHGTRFTIRLPAADFPAVERREEARRRVANG